MSLAVSGIGLVSPMGTSPSEHVFFLRAGAEGPPASPFATNRGDPFQAWFCPWLGASASVPDRLTRMADLALRHAFDPIARELEGGRVMVYLCLPQLRPGFTEEQRGDVSRAVALRIKTTDVSLFAGECGAFVALTRAAEAIERGLARAVVLVGLDSLVATPTLTDFALRPPPFWSDDVPPPSEGASALVLTSPEEARRLGEPFGTVFGAATQRGTSTDLDDEIVDGSALTALLQRLPNKGPIGLVVGQAHTDELRRREWHIASARTARRYPEQLTVLTLEKDVGRAGAATAGMSLAYGLALHRHRAIADDVVQNGPFLAWAISTDGVRGAALAQGALGASRAVVPRAAHVVPEMRVLSTSPFTDVPAEAPPNADPTPPKAPDALLRELLGSAVDEEVIPRERAANDAAEPPLAVVLEGPGLPLPPSDAYREIAFRCLDTMAMLGRHRTERRADERAAEELRLLELVDALAAIGQPVFELMTSWWEEALDSPDPWKVLAPMLALGCLPDHALVETAPKLLEALSPDATASARIAGETLAGTPHPDRALLSEALRASPHPVLRAAGVELASRLGLLATSPILAHLADPEPPVLVMACSAAVREALATAAARRGPDAPDPRYAALLRPLLRHADREVAWAACRALARLGHPDAYDEIRSDPTFAAALGGRVLDVLVLFGDASDLPLVEAALRRGPVTAAHLRALGRLGHPRTWAFLTHFLSDADLAPDAAAALSVMFGDAVPRADREKPGAWRKAIAAKKLDPDARIRRAKPWSLASVSAELTRGSLARAELEDLVDEAAVRTGVPLRLDLALWGPPLEQEQRAALEAIERAGRTFGAGSFQCRTRAGGWRES